MVIEYSPPINAKERKMEQEDRLTEGFAAQGPRALCSEAATVPGSNSDTEGNLIGQQQWQAIHDRRAGGQSISAIAREMQLDRKTVRSCALQQAWAPYQRKAIAPTLLDPHRAWLAERAPHVHYSARILHQELRAKGYSGCYETVKLAVRPLRAAASVAALTQRRFETGPGEQAQVDWGQIGVTLGGVRTKVHVLVMTLGYSRRGYAEGFLHERLPNLLAAHENAFAHFGGRCEFILYDRMRTVVVGSQADAQGRTRPKFNTTFETFVHYWGFTPRLCQPYRAQTKGKVESGVKYVKRNFAPGRVFADLEDFNAQLAAWQASVADERIHGTTHQRPIERFKEGSHSAGAHGWPAQLPGGHGARARGGRRLAGVHRRQSLLGALCPDRQDRASGARGRPLGGAPPWRRGGSARGAGRARADERTSGARAGGGRAQRAYAIRRLAHGGAERAAAARRARGPGARVGRL
ncbi:MAG TPA: IS21 family transposase [Burkholderiaceae bacterium]|nr:IS21 family transposase [Burkholderiaceae bacterium]